MNDYCRLLTCLILLIAQSMINHSHVMFRSDKWFTVNLTFLDPCTSTRIAMVSSVSNQLFFLICITKFGPCCRPVAQHWLKGQKWLDIRLHFQFLLNKKRSSWYNWAILNTYGTTQKTQTGPTLCIFHGMYCISLIQRIINITGGVCKNSNYFDAYLFAGINSSFCVWSSGFPHTG